MNIKQAKQEFTNLTGLPAKRKSILTAILKFRGHYSSWLNYGIGKYPEAKDLTDTRTLHCWLSLVGYLKVLKEIR